MTSYKECAKNSNYKSIVWMFEQLLEQLRVFPAEQSPFRTINALRTAFDE
jgi:hypothetical protein